MRIESNDISVGESTQFESRRNDEVIEAFFRGDFPHTSEEYDVSTMRNEKWGTRNLTIQPSGYGWALVNYWTPIVYRDSNGAFWFNTDRYSVTTSKIQNQIRREASYQGINMREVNEDRIRKAIEAERE